jgi:hypothetical protein
MSDVLEVEKYSLKESPGIYSISNEYIFSLFILNTFGVSIFFRIKFENKTCLSICFESLELY